MFSSSKENRTKKLLLRGTFGVVRTVSAVSRLSVRRVAGTGRGRDWVQQRTLLELLIGISRMSRAQTGRRLAGLRLDFLFDVVSLCCIRPSVFVILDTNCLVCRFCLHFMIKIKPSFLLVIF